MPPLDLPPQKFRELASRIVDLSTEYLETLDSRSIFPATTGEESERLFHSTLPEEGLADAALNDLPAVIDHSRAQNARFFGYVLGSGEPVAALGDLLASVLTQNVTAWRSGPAAVTIERTVIAWLAQAIGCQGFSGSLTGGGSSANLMGLAMAREAKLAVNDRGLYSSVRAVVYASSEVHMSIPRALALLGMGRENLRLLPVGDDLRLIASALDSAIQADKAAGRIPVAVVASAGTVNTGAVDPLAEIAAISQRHSLWFHVDGAYGALAALAVPERFRGLALADSISLDPHKWLYQPLDCGCLLYKDASIARKSFAYTGDYARVLSEDPIEGFAFFEESMELSRRFRALKLWMSLRYHGMARFRQAIHLNLEHAQRLREAISGCPDLELAAPVELSAVCFRHRVKEDVDEEMRNRFNTALLRGIQHQGTIYLSNAIVRGKFCLRACIVNHRTTDADVDAVVPEVLAAARECTERE